MINKKINKNSKGKQILFKAREREKYKNNTLKKSINIINNKKKLPLINRRI